MNAKKQREKDRRRAGKLAEQAWEAADEGNLDLAVKIIRRAVELHPRNPVLWHDQGRLLVQLGTDGLAAAAFQAAIHAAPDFAEAYAGLADIRARQGQAEQAVMLQRQAVRHAPTSDRYRNALAAYEALLAAGCHAATNLDWDLKHDLSNGPIEPKDDFPSLTTRIETLDWAELGDSLTRHGLAHLPKLLDSEQCEALRSMFDGDRGDVRVAPYGEPDGEGAGAEGADLAPARSASFDSNPDSGS